MKRLNQEYPAIGSAWLYNIRKQQRIKCLFLNRLAEHGRQVHWRRWRYDYGSVAVWSKDDATILRIIVALITIENILVQ